MKKPSYTPASVLEALLKKWCLLTGIFFLTGCAGLQLREPKTEEEKLYRQKCASCHTLLPKGKYTKEEWKKSVEKYGDNIHLSQDEKNKILKYLISE